MREKERESEKGRERERMSRGEEEADSLLSRDPNVGLKPRTLDHDLSGRKIFNPLSQPSSPFIHLIFQSLVHCFVLLTPDLPLVSVSAADAGWLPPWSLCVLSSNWGVYSWGLRDQYWLPQESEVPGAELELEWTMVGIPGWLSSLAPVFGLGHDPRVQRSPVSGSLHGACFSPLLCLCLSLSLCLSWINK